MKNFGKCKFLYHFIVQHSNHLRTFVVGVLLQHKFFCDKFFT